MLYFYEIEYINSKGCKTLIQMPQCKDAEDAQEQFIDYCDEMKLPIPLITRIHKV